MIFNCFFFCQISLSLILRSNFVLQLFFLSDLSIFFFNFSCQITIFNCFFLSRAFFSIILCQIFNYFSFYQISFVICFFFNCQILFFNCFALKFLLSLIFSVKFRFSIFFFCEILSIAFFL